VTSVELVHLKRRFRTFHSTQYTALRKCFSASSYSVVEMLHSAKYSCPASEVNRYSKYKQYKAYGKFEVLSPFYRRSFAEEERKLNNEAARLLIIVLFYCHLLTK